MLLATIFLAASLRLAAGDFFQPQCTSTGLSCLDCFTQKFCMGKSVWYNLTCYSGNSKSPTTYCNPKTNQCSKDPPPECSDASSYRCPQPNGVFPDLYNCSRYVECQNNTARIMECSSRYIYDPKLGKCVLQMEESDCLQIRCNIAEFTHVHPRDPALFYQCKGSSGLSLFSCPQNEIYNETSKKCENICKAVGLIGDPKNCLEYISCEASGSSVIAVRRSCAPGYGFNPFNGSCEEGLQQLCYEDSVVRDSFAKASFIPPFAKNLLKKLGTYLRGAGLNYASIFKLGVPQRAVSSALLTLNYILTHRWLPPLVSKRIVQGAVAFLSLYFPGLKILPLIVRVFK